MGKQLKFQKGFSLAEVLLVITILGVIASLTLPGLIYDVQEQQYETGWKKNFSAFSQMFEMLREDNGGTLAGLCADADELCMMNVYKRYLKILNNDTATTTDMLYWHHLDGSVVQMDGTPVIASANNWIDDSVSAILADGSTMLVDHTNENCSSSLGGSINGCGLITIDINGFKNPNTVGKDIYRIYVLNNGIVPGGYSGTQGDCSANGWGCGSNKLLNL